MDGIFNRCVARARDLRCVIRLASLEGSLGTPHTPAVQEMRLLAHTSITNHGCPSIRAKALSRAHVSWRCVSTACFAREIEDQDAGNLTLNQFCGGTSFHQPSIRPKPRP